MTVPLLDAPGPDPHHVEELMLYGRFAGTWHVEARQLGSGGWQEVRGEWHFGWGLRGLAVIDVIHSPPRAELEAGQPIADIGTTIRVYDPPSHTWQITFVTAVSRRVERLIGRRVHDEIHQEGIGSDGRPIRWNFSDITPKSFTWRGYASNDAGGTWVLNEEMLLRRSTQGSEA